MCSRLQEGGIYRFFLNDISDDLRQYNTRRCAHAEMPRCLCANAAPPPPYMVPPPPPRQYNEDWTQVAMEPNADPYRGRTTAYIKRIVSAPLTCSLPL